MTQRHFPPEFEAAFDRLLAAIGRSERIEPHDLAMFWPMVGHAYGGGLMVVGRAVNGWIDRIDALALADPAVRASAVAAARATSEESGGCPLRWVTDQWGRPSGEYSTARSAFWRIIRDTLAAVDPSSRTDPLWSSRLTWTNLAKLAPWSGGNPGGELFDLQRAIGPELLAAEIAALRPRRVLVLTGAWWFEPFAARMGLRLEPGTGLVEAVARDAGTTWVIAPHPQGKPRRLLDDVIEAFEAPAA